LNRRLIIRGNAGEAVFGAAIARTPIAAQGIAVIALLLTTQQNAITAAALTFSHRTRCVALGVPRATARLELASRRAPVERQVIRIITTFPSLGCTIAAHGTRALRWRTSAKIPGFAAAAAGATIAAVPVTIIALFPGGDQRVTAGWHTGSTRDAALPPLLQNAFRRTTIAARGVRIVASLRLLEATVATS